MGVAPLASKLKAYVGSVSPRSIVAGGVSQGISQAGGFNFDTSGLQEVETRLEAIITKFDALDDSIKKVVGSLGKVAPAMAGATGGGNGPGGPGNTSAVVSAYAGMDVASNFAGYLNQRQGQIQSYGIPIQAMAAQQQSIFGLQGGGNTRLTTANVQQWGQVNNLGGMDSATAFAMMMANPAYNAGPGTRNRARVQNLLNTVSGLNPLGGATGAAQFATALDSPAASMFFQRRGVPGGGLYNAMTGQLNTPQQTFNSLIQAMTMQRMTGSQMQQFMQGPQGIRHRFQMQQLASQSGFITQPMLQAVEQYMGQGGNLTRAQRQMGGTVAQTMMRRLSAGTQTGLDIMQSTTALQNAENNAAASLQDFAQHLKGVFPELMGLSQVTGIAMQALSSLAGLKVLKDLFLGSKGSGGLVRGVKNVLTRGSKTAGTDAAETTAVDTTATVGEAGTVTGAVAAAPVVGAAASAAALGLSIYAVSQLKASRRKVHGVTMPPPGSVPDDRGGFYYKGKDYKSADEFYNKLGDPTGSTTTSGMQPNLARGITAMQAANPSIRINSGHRSKTQQAMLFALKGGRGVARPGQSPHQLGKAADLGPPSQFGWIAANAQRYGLQTDRGEPWHVQAMGDPSSPVGAGLKQGRVDQGVDWGGNGPIYAVGSGTIINVSANDPGGWGSVYIVLKLDNPPDAQHSAVYYAENIVPSVKVGQRVAAGQVIGQATGGIEIGWASSTMHVALGASDFTGNNATSAGQNFLSWIQGAAVPSGAGGTGSGGGTQSQAATQAGTGASASTATAMPLGGRGGLGSSFVAGLSNYMPFGGGAPAARRAVSSTSVAQPSTGGGSAVPSTTNVSVPASGTMSDAQVQAAWIKAGGPANVAKTMAGIAMAESSDEPGIVQKGQPYSTTGWGLWQITPGNSEPQVGIDQALLDPVTNAKAALAKYQGAGNTLRPWTGDHYLTGHGIDPSSSGIGDPMGPPNLSVPSGSHSSRGGGAIRGGGRSINVQIGPIYVQGTQADANNIASMVASAIKSNQEIAAVSGA